MSKKRDSRKKPVNLTLDEGVLEYAEKIMNLRRFPRLVTLIEQLMREEYERRFGPVHIKTANKPSPRVEDERGNPVSYKTKPPNPAGKPDELTDQDKAKLHAALNDLSSTPAEDSAVEDLLDEASEPKPPALQRKPGKKSPPP